MYGYEHTPANEGVLNGLLLFVTKVGEKIKEFARWLKDSIVTIAKRLKKGRNGFATNDGNAKQLVTEIGSKTESFITECAKAINTMYAGYLSVGKVSVKSDNSANNVDVRLSGSFDYKKGHMEKGDNVEKDRWNKFQEIFGKLFTNMHSDADEIRKKLIELQSMPTLSYQTTVDGYKELKRLYDANGDFGREWSQLKTAHEFADAGKIRKALGKIVSMYNVGVNAAKAFANRLNRGNFTDDTGKKYDKDNQKYKDAKDELEKGGAPSAAKDKTAIASKRGFMNADELLIKLANKKSKNENGNESAMLSELYDMAYEDARRDFEMKAEYIRAFESVPDAFEEFSD